MYYAAGGVPVYSVTNYSTCNYPKLYKGAEFDSTFQSAYLNNGQTDNNCDLVIQWYLYCMTPAMSDFLPFTTDFSGTDGFTIHFDLR